MIKKILHYPRLDTVLKVEKIIKNAKGPLSKNEIDRRLKTKIMRPTLNVILDYLEENGKIAILKEGIIWIYLEDASPKLKEIIKNGVEVRKIYGKNGEILFKKR
jgi:hypothetical protein